MTERQARIAAFLADAGWGGARQAPLPGDASFRRYTRLHAAGGQSAMLMDAPPPQEDVRPFVAVDRALRDMDLAAPGILAADEQAGLLLLEDFGDETFTRALAAGQDEERLYALATDVLISLHRHPASSSVSAPVYDDDLLLGEAALLPDWFYPAMTGNELPSGARRDYDWLFRDALGTARDVPETLVLRDYHVDNLMLRHDAAGISACGLLDFQDAVIGPVSYDLMSLVEDARRDIAPGLHAFVLARYLDAFPAIDRDAFERSFAILGASRHAKVVGIFTRLDRRDGKPVYLDHIPRVWRLLERNLSHPALADLRAWFDAWVPAEMRRRPDPSGGPA